MSMRHTLLVTTALAGTCVSMAQAPAFEVASVRRNLSNEPPGGSISRPAGGRFQANNVTLRTLIRTAYDVQDFQISGGLRWLDGDRFDVSAKAEGNVTWPEARIMLQDLLANRFRLVLHRESRPTPVYLMVIAKGGPKLRPPTDPACQPPPLGACGGIRIENRSALSGVNVSTAQLARVLTTFMGRPVLDKTGITGIFDFKMDWVIDLPRSGEPANFDDAVQAVGPSVFTSLQEQLGLRLASQKSPLEILVISRAEEPAAN
jgi:uncharacterized protein (TIGR03435 family)